ncbi:unnamed protein product, partial [Dovyalis caffra]
MAGRGGGGKKETLQQREEKAKITSRGPMNTRPYELAPPNVQKQRLSALPAFTSFSKNILAGRPLDQGAEKNLIIQSIQRAPTPPEGPFASNPCKYVPGSSRCQP